MNSILSLLQGLVDKVVSVLPQSPFQQYIDMFGNLPYLGYLNWFIPVGTFVKISVAWLGAIALFYLYSIIMRWVKIIGD